MLAERLISYYLQLNPPLTPPAYEVLFPYRDAQVKKVVQTFFKKYYSDNLPRKLILGINPGRHGAGITGINFTAPRQLKENCHIQHPWDNSSELSAEFIYAMIETYGGADQFYSNWFLGAMSPLGFTKAGKNINYYDDAELQKAVRPFIVDSINKILDSGIDRQECICIGGGKNAKFLTGLNNEYGFFRSIRVLPHPRFIMQYKRKQLNSYIREYIEVLR